MCRTDNVFDDALASIFKGWGIGSYTDMYYLYGRETAKPYFSILHFLNYYGDELNDDE